MKYVDRKRYHDTVVNTWLAPILFLYRNPIIIVMLILLLNQIPTSVMAKRDEEALQKCKEVGFKPIAGKLDSKTSKIILAEFHNKRANTSICLDAIAKGEVEHSVLIDGINAGEKHQCSFSKLTNQPNRVCVGGDDASPEQNDYDPRLTGEVIALHAFNLGYKDRLKQNKNDKKISTVALDLSIKQFIASNEHLENTCFSEVCNVSLEVRNQISAVKVAKEIMEHRAKNKSYEKIFAKDNYEELFNASFVKTRSSEDPVFAKQMLHRNKVMLSTLLKQTTPFSVGIFGYYHVVNFGKEVGKAAEYFRNELERGKDQNPYAILAMEPEDIPYQNNIPHP